MGEGVGFEGLAGFPAKELTQCGLMVYQLGSGAHWLPPSRSVPASCCGGGETGKGCSVY